MTIRRVVPNLKSDEFEKNQRFYETVLGLSLGMNLGWIATFGSSTNPTAQLSVIYGDEPSGIKPDLTIEVSDIEDVYAKAVANAVQIVYPLTDEPWGVRRFFAVDPNGMIVNIMSHPTE